MFRAGAATTGGGGAIGYSAVVTMFGSATYNADGTVTGTPNGAVYTYNPDNPDSNTTATVQANFASDFANFTQGSVHCTRTDTALRVYFRKDVSPDPTRIEVILELGHPTTDGSAANLGSFALQILKAGVAQNISVYTQSGAGNTWVAGGSTFTGFTNVTTAYFPSMGWFTRWRWNPAPRAEVRTPSQLLPGNLNLVPNFSASLATQFRAINVGQSGARGYAATAYSSAGYPTSNGANNKNPTGVNEPICIATGLGGTGDRPELGVLTEWNANYLINGLAAAKTTTYVCGEIHAGMPFAIRDPANNWAPPDLVKNVNIGFGGSGNYDTPTVYVPSSSGTYWDTGDVNHLPPLSYFPYLLTGDPFYLENMQFAANWIVGKNWYHRENGYVMNVADPNSPIAANPGSVVPLFPSYRGQSRGMAWAARDFTFTYLATPASIPNWLLPRSYAQSVLNQNQTYADNNSGSPGGSGANHDYIVNSTHLAAFGQAPGTFTFEEGFFMSYLLMGLGFVINQGRQSNWQNYYAYAATLPIGWASGANPWPQNWPSPYALRQMVVSTDYNGNPAAITNFTDYQSYNFANAFHNNAKSDYWGNAGEPVMGSAFPTWAPNTAYKCNSWILEMRSGWPQGPNAGDVISFTISGTFAGSPVTVSHTITASDVTFIAGVSYLTLSGTSPITDVLISAINASAAGTAGIKADYANSATSGWWFNEQRFGRIYLSFDATVAGNISVTGSYTSAGPLNASSTYVQPNGDGVHNGVAGANLFGRPLNYQCAASGTSAASGGPTGQTLQTPTITDGTTKWCYVPEAKVPPLFVPASTTILPAPPRLAQIFTERADGGYPQPPYAYWTMAGLSMAQTAGVSGASAARSNVLSTMTDWLSFDSTFKGSFGFSIAP